MRKRKIINKARTQRPEIYYTKTKKKIEGILPPYSVENLQKVQKSGIINLYLTGKKFDISKSIDRQSFLKQQQKEIVKRQQHSTITKQINFVLNRLNDISKTLKED